MRVRDVLEGTRETVLEGRRLADRAQERMAAIGVGGHTYEYHAKVGVLDPMRKVIDVIDWQSENERAIDVAGAVDEARTVLSGLSKVSDQLSIDVADAYYVQALSLRDVAREFEDRMPALAGMGRDEQAALLSKAMEAMLVEFDQYGIAHLREMAR